MIERHYSKTISTERLQTVSGNKQAFSTFLSNIPCHIQPFTAEDTQDIQGSFGKDFLLFCSSTHDISENDQIIEGTKKYRILAVEKFAFMKQCKHQELRIRIFE